MDFIAAAKRACSAASTGRCRTFVLAGSLPRKLSPFQFLAGRIGLGTKPPPQFGQTFPRTSSTHAAQNVHSYVQMRASSESGGRGLLQFSQVGLRSSMRIRREPSARYFARLSRTYQDRRNAATGKSKTQHCHPGPALLREHSVGGTSHFYLRHARRTSGAIP